MKIINFLRDVLINGNTNRFWQFLNKTPLMIPVSWLRRLQYASLNKTRSQALQNLELSPDLTEPIQNLRAHGYASVSHLLSKSDIEKIETYISEKQKRSQEIRGTQLVTSKDFWIRLSDDDLAAGLTTSNPLVNISLNENILKIVAHYLGQIPFLEYVLMTLSVPSKKPLQSSQLWHLDRDNDRMLKFFIYLTDVVDIGDGPFTFVPAEESKKVKNSFVLRHLPDQQVFKTISEKKITQMRGKKWTAFICDTSRCYHMGSRLHEGHERLMLTSLYIALPSVYPSQGQAKIKIDSQVSSLQKMAISAH
jgi:hypothetical protein